MTSMIYSSIIFNDISLFSDIYRASQPIYTCLRMYCTVRITNSLGTLAYILACLYICFNLWNLCTSCHWKLFLFHVYIADVYRSLYGNFAYYVFVSIVYELWFSTSVLKLINIYSQCELDWLYVSSKIAYVVWGLST